MNVPWPNVTVCWLLSMATHYLGHSQRTINDWNQSSHDCVNASSVNMFENKIDNYLARVGYT